MRFFLIDINLTKDLKTRLGIYAIFAIILGIMQITIVPLLEAWEGIPNLLLVFSVWIVITEGKLIGFISAFLLGIIYDIFTLQVIGVSSFAFLISALIASFFYKPDKLMIIFSRYNFVFIVFLCAFAANLIQNIFYVRLSQIDFWVSFVYKWLISTVYTSFVAIIPYYLALKSRK